ncbi:MAG TPA: ATP-binding cassette domain-containing protein [Caldithrix abyssi]|uniref:ATP-binding cassette domain-containing protein n=1 Tax=Caldithrix abyssi TaxID=187145 RepID=A0A7V4WW70_CALAY|nr:ATP-binding cassette domain-containing protein [Caldithrix abyssi]
MQTPIIEIKNLSSGYEEDVLILKDVNLTIYPNQITTILGTSGCGKTTLLKHLIGLLTPLEGELIVLGKNLAQIDENEMNSILRKMGVLFQNGALLNSISVAENIAIPLEQHTSLSKDLIEHLIRIKLELVGLSHAYHLLPSELSGGMRKRAALARALALDPQILFADEPSAGLDPVTTAALDHLLISLQKQLGMTVVVVTHEVNSIRRIADRVVYLDNGQILFSGTLDEALQSPLPQLQSFFS